MDSSPLGEVADQDLGTVVELESHNVEIPVVVQIKNRGRTAGQAPGHGDDAALARAEIVCPVRPGTVEGEPFPSQPAVPARLNAEQEFTVEEAFSPFVQQDRVNRVAEWVPHAGGDKNILITVRIEVADADSPRPIGFHTQHVRDLDKDAVAFVLIESVPE